MDAAKLIREARRRSGLSLRELARRASTSHSAISAYESGLRSPTAETLDRVVRAAGFALDITLCRRIYGDDGDRGAELEEVLLLAEEFPVRHSLELAGPAFKRMPRRSGQ